MNLAKLPDMQGASEVDAVKALSAIILPHPVESSLANARVALRRRRDRRNLLGSTRFVDGPAWEMLMDLYIHHLEKKRLGIGALCVTSDLPMTSAVRLLDKLLSAGLVRRVPDPDDRRRCFIELDDRLLGNLHRYFASG